LARQNEQPVTTQCDAGEQAMSEWLFGSSFNSALAQRKKSSDLRNTVNAFSASFQDYIYRPCPSDTVAGAILRDSLTHSFKKIVSSDSCGLSITNKTKLKRCLLPPQPEFFSINNAELIKHQLDTRLEAQDDEYRIYWSAWLRTVQYRGLVLFALITLFLLVVWYYAYTSWLDTEETKEKPRENFSEINISKISIYIIFLLTIPFFKPITRDSTAFSKPYITFSNPLTLVDNSNTVLHPTVEFPEIPEINYNDLADAVQKKMEQDGGKLWVIEEIVKRTPEKKSKKP
jgi:ribosomal protein L18E